MTLLQCEICGGKLVGKPGGLYECEYCGMQFDTAWAKAKIQEIKGTVQVEGTVEVKGTVTLDGPVEVKGGVSLENLLKRGYLILEDQKWGQADQIFDEALNINAECAEAYVGKLLAELNVQTPEALADCEEILSDKRNFQKALRFADSQLRNTLEDCAKRDDEKKSKQKLLAYRQRRLKHMVLKLDGRILAVRSNGTVLVWNCDNGNIGTLEPTDIWHDIIEIAVGRRGVYGLRCDGTVVTDDKEIVCRNVATLFTSPEAAVGLKDDGTVVFDGDAPDYAEKLTGIVDCCEGYYLKADGTVIDDEYCPVTSKWKDIVSVSNGPQGFYGLKADGTVEVEWYCSEENMPAHWARVVKDGYPAAVKKWGDIVQISGCYDRIVGLQSDGNVVAIENGPGFCLSLDYSWRYSLKNIVAINTNIAGTVALSRDGTLMTVKGIGGFLQCDEKLFQDIENLEQERETARIAREAREAEARMRAEEERIARQKREEAERIARQKREEEAARWRNAGRCQHCGGELKGLFGKKCVACGKSKDY